MSETIKNLTKAFIGESQARNKYARFAEVADEEGFKQISEIFLITADNEKEHAFWFLKMINDLQKKEELPKEMPIDIGIPTLGKTKDNLKTAIAGETFEYTKLYKGFAETADKEGFKEVAARIRAIMKAEEHHAERYSKLSKNVDDGTVFKKSKETWWVCRECGYVHYGKEPPVKCPSCDNPRSFYQVKSEEY